MSLIEIVFYAVVVSWCTAGLLGCLQANAVTGGAWVDWLCVQIQESWTRVGGLADTLMILVAGVLWVLGCMVLGPFAFLLSRDRQGVYEIEFRLLLIPGLLAAMWWYFYHGEDLLGLSEDSDYSL